MRYEFRGWNKGLIERYVKKGESGMDEAPTSKMPRILGMVRVMTALLLIPFLFGMNTNLFVILRRCYSSTDTQA